MITSSEREKAISVITEAVAEERLQSIASSIDIYLPFQRELQRESGRQRAVLLAKILVSALGERLLSLAEFREALAKHFGVSKPTSWHPGSFRAIQFTENCQLPTVFAGETNAEQVAPIELVIPPSRSDSLAPYQIEVIDKTERAFTSGNSALLSIPTGAGKTRCASEIVLNTFINTDGHGSCVWLAHSDELCEQAVRTLANLWRKAGAGPCLIVRFWGKHSNKRATLQRFIEADAMNGLNRRTILVTTPLSGLKLTKEPISTTQFSNALNDLKLIVIDEAHRAAAPTYRSLVKTLKSSRHVHLLGLTATPVRGYMKGDFFRGSEELTKMFDELIEPSETLGDDPVSALREMGYLSELSTKSIAKLSSDDSEVAKAIANDFLNDPVRPSLVFARDVSHALSLGVRLRLAGLSVEIITASTSNAERTRAIELLKAGRVDLVVNCEILTTGFDAPNVARIYLARTTSSPVLYKQIIGRGLRGPRFGGTPRCELVLCGVSLQFSVDPNTSEFARIAWAKR